MGKAHRIGFSILRKTTLYLAIKVLLTLVVLVYAATIVTTSNTYQASIGGAINVTNSLKAMDKGFSIALVSSSAAGTSCEGNVTFAVITGTANNNITSGHIIFLIQVNSTTSADPTRCFTVTLAITPSAGPQQTFAVYIATDSTPANDEIIDCKFDIGTSLPTSPYSFKVTVQ